MQVTIVGPDGEVSVAETGGAYKERLDTAKKSLFANISLSEYMAEQQKELVRRIVDSAEGREPMSGGSALQAAKAASMIGKTISALEQDREFLKRRLAHAIKRLKARGLWAPTYDGLVAICSAMGGQDPVMAKAAGMLQLVSCCMGDYDMTSVASADQLDENCWMIGIELAMAEREPALMASDQLYGFAIPRNIDLIYVYTVMAGFSSKLTRVMSGDNFYSSKIFDDILDRYLESETGMEAIRQATERTWGAIKKEADGQVKAADDRRQAAEAKLETLSARLKEADARPKALERRNAKLEEASRELAEERDAMAREIEALKAALENKNRLISRMSGVAEFGFLPALPERNVVFVGGHPNMLKKLVQEHPGWRFIDGGDYAFDRFSSQPAILFFWDGHMGHPCFARAKKFLEPATPVGYVKSTNIDMLEGEMRRIWAPYAEGGDGYGRPPVG